MSIFARALVVLSLLCATALGEEPEVVTFKDSLGAIEVGMPSFGAELTQSERVLAPKVVTELRFVSKEGPAAVLVSTKIRAELPKDDRVLDRLEPKYQSFKAEHQGHVLLEFRGQSPARTLEFAVSGGEYQEAFPYVVGGHIGLDDPPKSVTISQFFVTSDRLFEVAIYLPNPDKSSQAELFTRARKVCDDWRATIAVKR